MDKPAVTEWKYQCGHPTSAPATPTLPAMDIRERRCAPATIRDLPIRPALLPGVPVLRRSAESVQLGLDPWRAVVLDWVSEPLLAALDELDGRHEIDQLSDLVVGLGGRRADLLDLLGQLADHGLLIDAHGSDAARLPRWLAPDAAAWSLGTGRSGRRAVHVRRASTVAVHGGGRLGIAIACALAGAGVGQIELLADGVVCPEDIGTGYCDTDVGRPVQDAARAAIARSAPTSAHGPLGEPAEADLVVLADTLVPDPAVAAALLAAGTPHLPALAHGGRGVVGPLVLPGRSSCLRCVDLQRTAVDPCWPTLSAQLCCRPQHGDLCTTLAVAALAAGQVVHALGWAEAARWAPPAWGATVELDSLRGALAKTRWQPHPDCGCGAAGW